MTKLLQLLVKIYQNTFSLLLVLLFGRGCRYSPTCSQYSYEAMERHGALKGTLMSIRRLSKCHPWGGSGYYPVEK